MTTLTVWKYDTPTGAENALQTLERLQKEGLIQVEDGAIVTWQRDAKKPKTKQMHSMVGLGTLGGGFWGFLFGLIFFVPFLGLALGAAAGAIAGSLTHVGIDDDFIENVRKQVTPGTSALFLMTDNVVIDKVRDAFVDEGHPDLIFTNLSDAQERTLREAFADE